MCGCTPCGLLSRLEMALMGIGKVGREHEFSRRRATLTLDGVAAGREGRHVFINWTGQPP